MARYLRFAAAVSLGLLALAFVALWLRSYFWEDYFVVSAGDDQVTLNSRAGITAVIYEAGFLRKVPAYETEAFAIPMREAPPWLQQLFSFAIGNDPAPYLTLPHWFLALSPLALAALLVFKRHWRFTVRGLLIATTLLAAILGLVVYAVRS